ncbi:hypothetical protein X801_07432 [Opisthorchis viverrini]|uniref:Uncharacterized protein n=1 Tax=Opisthorchis viverrini TaxID=6198 RepID=A0A1S8WQS0_OPIVI|nr:hypothetical protein X801_07432 [Opisthorchis viverrini]
MSAFSPSVSAGGKHSPDTELELTNLRAEIQTLTEQVEALRAKREEDRQRLQEMERMKIQFTQLEENRRLMREQAAELQRNLAQIKTVGCFVSVVEHVDYFGHYSD